LKGEELREGGQVDLRTGKERPGKGGQLGAREVNQRGLGDESKRESATQHEGQVLDYCVRYSRAVHSRVGLFCLRMQIRITITIRIKVQIR
jgi:hypothetical protein